MSKYGSNLSFIDFLFNMLLAFISLFILTFILIRPVEESKDNKVEIQGEIAIVVSWPADKPDDVDLWIQDPQSNIIFWGQKDIGLMHLDRDDLGDVNDVMDANGERVILRKNEEMAIIRKVVPGQYTVNIHMYRKISNGTNPVHIDIFKIKPYGVICTSDENLEIDNQEETACRFEIGQSGELVSVSEISKSLMGRIQ